MNQRNNPVTEKTKIQADTNIPAAAISPFVKAFAIATAAMAFIGWTGNGMPKNSPVRMLATPEKTRVLEREMVPFMDRAMAMGRKVPRSPSAPDISAVGCDLRIRRFRAEMSRKVLMNDIVRMRVYPHMKVKLDIYLYLKVVCTA